MADIVVALPKLEDAKNLRRLLVRNGYDVGAVCDSGARTVEALNRLDGGVLICGYRFADMHYYEIYDYLPKGFQMLLLASPAKIDECGISGLMTLSMPFKLKDLLNTLETMFIQYGRWKKKQKDRPKVRTESEKKIIAAAKDLLIERNNMTEGEAHRYIQKLSMDSATGMVETARMIMELNGKEWEL